MSTGYANIVPSNLVQVGKVIATGGESNLSITGLDLVSDGTYFIFWQGKRTAAGALNLMVNNDLTTGNYYTQQSTATSTTIATSMPNVAQIASCSDTNENSGWIVMQKRSGLNPIAHCYTLYNAAAGSYQQLWTAWFHNSTTNVTEIDIQAAGSTFIANFAVYVYKITKT